MHGLNLVARIGWYVLFTPHIRAPVPLFYRTALKGQSRVRCKAVSRTWSQRQYKCRYAVNLLRAIDQRSTICSEEATKQGMTLPSSLYNLQYTVQVQLGDSANKLNIICGFCRVNTTARHRPADEVIGRWPLLIMDLLLKNNYGGLSSNSQEGK